MPVLRQQQQTDQVSQKLLSLVNGNCLAVLSLLNIITNDFHAALCREVVQQCYDGRSGNPCTLQDGEGSYIRLGHCRQSMTAAHFQFLTRLGNGQSFIYHHQHFFIQGNIFTKIIGKIEFGIPALIATGHHLHPSHQIVQISAALVMKLL